MMCFFFEQALPDSAPGDVSDEEEFATSERSERHGVSRGPLAKFRGGASVLHAPKFEPCSAQPIV